MAHSTVITHILHPPPAFLIDPFTLIVWWKTTPPVWKYFCEKINVSIGGDAGRPATAPVDTRAEGRCCCWDYRSVCSVRTWTSRTYRLELRPAAARATTTLCAAAIGTTTILNLASCSCLSFVLSYKIFWLLCSSSRPTNVTYVILSSARHPKNRIE